MQLRSYSTSDEESHRDYVLNCEDKFVVEYAYDGYLLCSEIVVCIGSTLLFSFLSLKLCSIKYDEPRRGSVNVVSLYGPPAEDTNSYHIRQICRSCKKGNCIDVDATYDRHKVYFSVVLIIIIAAISFLFADAEEFYHNSEILREAFWYGYGSLYVILFVVACIGLLVEIPMFTVYFVAFCIVNFFPKRLLFGRTLRQHEICLSYSLIISTGLTIVLFIYILSRGFLVSLVLATYPLEVGAILMTIGSGFIALLFVVWVAVHIGVESYEAKTKLVTTIIYLVPYGSLLIILTGFLLSYIYVILRLSIRLNDPVTSLVAACIPATVGFIAANRYKSGLTKIKKGISIKNEARKKLRELREVEVANFAAYELSHFAINPLSAQDDNDGETPQNTNNLEDNMPAESNE